MMYLFTQSNKKKEAGFTIVETLVAISVLLVAVTGAYSAAQTGLSSAIFSKNEVIAFYLAEEGVENIRNIRDENGINGRSWLTRIANPGDPCESGACYVDAVTNTLAACSSNGCPVILVDPSTGFYGYSTGNPTPFTRTITVTKVNAANPDEVSILVSIAWSKGSVVREFHVKENIMNWQ